MTGNEPPPEVGSVGWFTATCYAGAWAFCAWTAALTIGAMPLPDEVMGLVLFPLFFAAPVAGVVHKSARVGVFTAIWITAPVFGCCLAWRRPFFWGL